MGTRSAVGFRVDGKDIITYNHFDGYPDCAGLAVAEWIADVGVDGLDAFVEAAAGQARRMKPVKGRPTAAQKRRLKEFANTGVAGRSTDDWYCLLHGTQGDPDAILRAGCYEDSRGFLNDSLFCEYAYIVNFDEGVLEFYLGFQKLDGARRAGRYWEPDVWPERQLTPYEGEPHPNGHKNVEEYGPVALAGVYTFAQIAQRGAHAVVAAMNAVKTFTSDAA